MNRMKRLIAGGLITLCCGTALAQEPPARPDQPDGRQQQREEMRERLQQQQQRQNRAQEVRVPPTVQEVRDVIYATAPTKDGGTKELLLDAYFPRQSGEEPLPAIVYIHGGGFVSGDKAIGRAFSIALAQGGYFTVTISYRLADEAPLPAAIKDCKAAVRFLRANAEDLGLDPERIGVWGHSAGGHLAAYLGVTGNAPETHGTIGEHDDASSAVACVVDFFGPTDFATMPLERANLVRPRLFGEGDHEKKMAHASPMTFVDANDPPFLIIHGTEDNLVPIEQSDRFALKLKDAGVKNELIRVEGAGHGINDQDVLMQVVRFFDTHLNGQAYETLQRLLELRQREQEERQRQLRERQRDRDGGTANPPGDRG